MAALKTGFGIAFDSVQLYGLGGGGGGGGGEGGDGAVVTIDHL